MFTCVRVLVETNAQRLDSIKNVLMNLMLYINPVVIYNYILNCYLIKCTGEILSS